MEQLSPPRPLDPDAPDRVAAYPGDSSKSGSDAQPVPLRYAFWRLRRLVREIARREGKAIDLVVQGDDVTAPPSLVQAMRDPVMRLVGNAATHGIEPSDARAAAGKLRPGQVVVRAFAQPGAAVVEVSDDGRGLPQDAILSRAVEAGLVPSGEPLREEQICELALRAKPGGDLDAVRQAVEALLGRIDVSSKPDIGTTITLRMPTAPAVYQAAVVRVGGESYVLPGDTVEQTFRPRPHQLSIGPTGGERCDTGAGTLPVVRLDRILGVSPCPSRDARHGPVAVIIRDRADGACLLVDEWVGREQVRQTAVNFPGTGAAGPPGVSGAAVRGDGSPAVTLDVPGLIHLTQVVGPAVVAPAAATNAAA